MEDVSKSTFSESSEIRKYKARAESANTWSFYTAALVALTVAFATNSIAAGIAAGGFCTFLMSLTDYAIYQIACAIKEAASDIRK